MDEIVKKRAKKVVEAGMNIPLASLTESIHTNDKLEALLAKDFPEEIEISLAGVEYIKGEKGDTSEYPQEVSIKNLPEIQKVEVLNFPEQKAPIVNVDAPKINLPAPIVNVDAPIVELNQDEVVAELKNISNILSKEESGEIETTKIVDSEGNPVDFKDLFKNIKVVSNFGGGAALLDIAESAKGIKPLSGAGANGTVTMSSANTWYAVPSTVPSSSYVLIATIETGNGNVRFAFSNSGTPSSTNGNIAPAQYSVRLTSDQVVYYASDVANDVINWTTKII